MNYTRFVSLGIDLCEGLGYPAFFLAVSSSLPLFPSLMSLLHLFISTLPHFLLDLSAYELGIVLLLGFAHMCR